MKTRSAPIAVVICFVLAFAGLTACESEGDTEQQIEETAQQTQEAAEETARETGEAAEALAADLEAAFDDVDADSDGTVSQENWESWWEENDWFSNWDLDADGYVDENEFATRLEGRAFGEEFDTSLFAQWDEDGDERLGEDEFRSSLFDWMDEDDDDALDTDEWRFDVDA